MNLPAQTPKGVDTVNSADTPWDAPFESIDWWDMDAADPRQFHKGFRGWRYYAAPSMSRDGKQYAPREFRAGSAAAAAQIILRSPEQRGTITYWSEHTQRRMVVETIGATK